MSAEVKEDKREWWLLKDAQHDYLEWEPTRHTVSDFIHVVPASEKQRLQTLLEEACRLLKKAQFEERDRIYEDAGSPGFDGPMTIQTKYCEFLGG